MKALNSGHRCVLKNLSAIERYPLLGGNFKKNVTFGTFVRYSWHVRYLLCPLLASFIVKSLCYLFWHWFIPLSYKLQEVTSWEGSHSSSFLQSCRWKYKETSPMDVFKIWQLSANDFQVKTKGGKYKKLYYKKINQIRFFNIINIAECWCKIGCTSEASRH